MSRLIAMPFWLGLWALMSLSIDLHRMLLPDIFHTLGALGSLLVTPSFFQHLGITFARVLPGILIAALVGIPLGLCSARYATLGKILEPALSFFRGIPVAALFPVAIVLFGIGDGARLMLVIYVALPIIAVATFAGAAERKETRLRRRYLALAASKVAWHHHFTCVIWDALPSIFAGLKISLSISLVVVIVSEMFFVGGSGIGWFTWDQYQAFNFPTMYAAILVIGFVSLALNVGFDLASARLER